MLPGEAGKARADTITANFATQIYCMSNNHIHNTYAADYFARDWTTHVNSNTSENDRAQDPFGERPRTHGASTHQSLDHVLLPSDFITLRTGGPANGFIVEAYIGKGGPRFRANGKRYLKLRFDQRLYGQ